MAKEEQGINTQWTKYPVCPVCGHADQDWWDSLEPKNDGDSWETNCGTCDAAYTVTMSVDVNFCTHVQPSPADPSVPRDLGKP